MSYRKPGRRVSGRFVILTALLVGVLALFRLYTYYKGAAAPIPPGVTLGGIDFSSYKDRAKIREELEPIFAQAIGVHFENQLLVLDPAQIGFTVHVDETVDDAARYLEGIDFTDIAVREAIGLPQRQRDVPVRYSYDEAALRKWLEGVATQWNYDPIPARVDVPPVAVPIVAAAGVTETASVVETASVIETAGITDSLAQPDGATGIISDTVPAPTPTPVPIRKLDWMPGTPGQKVDVDASIPVILAALASTDQRMAELVLTPVAPPPPDMADLEAQLPRVLDTFPVFTAVSVHDLTTGERAQADGDAAFSAMTTIKPALALALVEALPNGIVEGDEDARQVGEWIDRAIGQGDDSAANAALAWYGGGDEAAGARRLTAFMQRLGLQNSFIQGGIGATAAAALVTPSNQRERPNTRPDANAQTTPDDLATLLGAIYDCTLDKGLLRTTFPTSITPQKCRDVLFYMTHNELRDSLWRGLRDYETQWIVHQHGLAYEQHGNTALVWGPAGPYSISIFIYNPALTDSSTSNQAILDLSRMIWDFFAFRRAESGVDPGDPPKLAPPAGYVATDQYAPSGANPAGR